MKKYILILSISIIAVLNFTLVKSKTGDITLKSLTELAQANADETLPNNPPLGTTVDNIVGSSTTTESRSEDQYCMEDINFYGYCGTWFTETCSWSVTNINHAVYKYDSYYVEGSYPAKYVTEWRLTSHYTISIKGSETCTGKCPRSSHHKY